MGVKVSDSEVDAHYGPSSGSVHETKGVLSMKSAILLAIKHLLAPVLYRHPPTNLSPYCLYTYLDVLYRTASLPDPVVEIGCHQCGTTILATRFLKEIGVTKEYIAIDTFGGFVPSQLDGMARYAHEFSANSLSLAQTILRLHCSEAQLVQRDIVTMPDDVLPTRISAALIDVDLRAPTEAALRKVYPRLSPGGIILVDDCGPESVWSARDGYFDFVTSLGLVPAFIAGMGMIAGESTITPSKGDDDDGR